MTKAKIKLPSKQSLKCILYDSIMEAAAEDGFIWIKDTIITHEIHTLHVAAATIDCKYNKDLRDQRITFICFLLALSDEDIKELGIIDSKLFSKYD